MEIQKLTISEANRTLVSVFMNEEYPLEIDFNWLMPVVEKIEQTRIDSYEIGVVIGFHNYCGIIIKNSKPMIKFESSKPYSKEMIIEGGKVNYEMGTWKPSTKIEAVWLAVVDFIKWYNKKGETK